MILRPLFQWRPTGGGGCHTIDSRIEFLHKQDWYKC